MVAKHKEQFEEKTHLPNVRSAFYNPLDFIRKDEGAAVRDINVLLDALLTPPRPGSHESNRHFYESARAIVAGYMAWVRFREPKRKRTLATLYHPQTQGKIERWHQTLKNRILLENSGLPGDLEAELDSFVEHNNHRRYHESLNNLTPADVYFGRGQTILLERERIKRKTIEHRRLQHRHAAA